jgi:hypothetical protein
MHAVRASPAGGRLSMPLLLRTRRNAVLAPLVTCPSSNSPASGNAKVTAELVVDARLVPAPIFVRDLELNADGQRASWPWKRQRYYRRATWHSNAEGQHASR